MKEDEKYTLDNDTYASTPGEVSFNPTVWIKHRPLVPATSALGLLTIFMIYGITSKISLIFLISLIGYAGYSWIKIKEHYTADSNGGVVVSTNPTLVAVSTDMSKGNGYYPAIKIIRYTPKRPVRIGDKIGTVSVYEDNYEYKDYWSNFYPLPIDYATDNPVEIHNEIERYPQEQWDDIKYGLSKISKPYKPGYYRINDVHTDWD